MTNNQLSRDAVEILEAWNDEQDDLSLLASELAGEMRRLLRLPAPPMKKMLGPTTAREALFEQRVHAAEQVLGMAKKLNRP